TLPRGIAPRTRRCECGSLDGVASTTMGEMGTFIHPITIIAPGGAETLDGLVDTGAMFTAIPSPLLERLGVLPFDTIPVRFTDGRQEQWRIGQVDAELDGRRRPILCLFGA